MYVCACVCVCMRVCERGMRPAVVCLRACVQFVSARCDRDPCR